MSGLIKGIVERSTPDVYGVGDAAPLLVDVNGRALTSMTVGGVAPALGVDNADAIAVSALVDKLIVMSRGQLFDATGADWNRAQGTPLGRAEVASVNEITGADGANNILGYGVSLVDSSRLFAQANHLSNGVDWDRERNNLEEIPLASASRTASTNSPDQINFNGQAIEVTLEVSVNPGGAETLQLVIEGKTSSGTYYTIATATADAFGGSTGIQTLTVGLGVSEASEAANGSGFAGTMVKRTWRARVVHSSTGAWTYVVDDSVNA